ncbi:MAG: 3-dehydroquinate synthase [Acidobacteriota bacterium]
MRQVRVRLRAVKDRSYPIFIGSGLLPRLGRELPRLCPAARYVIISDTRVARGHGAVLLRTLRRRRTPVSLITFPSGERHKTRRTKDRLEDQLVRLRCGRDAALLALGGGVVGDMTGFVAATYQRGIPYIQIPTTLLAMIDASVGGKTGVDHPAGKNLIGAFHQPRAVWTDVTTLSTLPARQFRAGLAEAVKHAAIADRALLRFLEKRSVDLGRLEPDVLERLVERNCRIKASVVMRDEQEAGLRQVLNFGHTVAHALETTAGYRLLHGEAVSVGMAVEATLSVRLGGLEAAERERLLRLLEALGLPTRLPSGIDPRAVVRATYADKKARRGVPLYTLPRRLGLTPAWGRSPVRPVEDRQVLRALREHSS